MSASRGMIALAMVLSFGIGAVAMGAMQASAEHPCPVQEALLAFVGDEEDQEKAPERPKNHEDQDDEKKDESGK